MRGRDLERERKHKGVGSKREKGSEQEKCWLSKGWGNSQVLVHFKKCYRDYISFFPTERGGRR